MSGSIYGLNTTVSGSIYVLNTTVCSNIYGPIGPGGKKPLIWIFLLQNKISRFCQLVPFPKDSWFEFLHQQKSLNHILMAFNAFFNRLFLIRLLKNTYFVIEFFVAHYERDLGLIFSKHPTYIYLIILVWMLTTQSWEILKNCGSLKISTLDYLQTC